MENGIERDSLLTHLTLAYDFTDRGMVQIYPTIYEPGLMHGNGEGI